MERRSFLKLMSSAALSASALGCREDAAIPLLTDQWGIPTASQQSLLVPQESRPESVVELFLMGGLCPWDTFYVAPEFGRPDAEVAPNTMWHTFQEGDDSVPEFFEICKGGNRSLYEPYATDDAGRTINLGPWLYPLRERPDLLARMRVFVMNHPFEPHDAATPLALSGHPRGTPRMATTGAHFQRYFRALEGPGRATPYAYTLFSSNSEIEAQFDINSASTAGLHSAAFKPLHLRLTENSPLPSQLRREHLQGWHGQVDSLRSAFAGRYASLLSQSTGAPLQSARGLSELASAYEALRYAPDLTHLLSAEALAAKFGTECQTVEPVLDDTAMGFGLAAHLVRAPRDAAKYVLYVDSGLVDATGAGYDTHENHVRESSRNVVHAMRKLTDTVNKPGENDPKKLDLDKQLVLLTTEFGRTPYPETGKPQGLDHWPFGYVVVAFGGPVDNSRAGIVGSINNLGYAESGLTPAEFRAALLLSMGIWPFSNAGFAVGDIPGATTEEEAARRLLERVWGYV